MNKLKVRLLAYATVITALFTWADYARADSMFGTGVATGINAGGAFVGGTNKYCLFNDNATLGQDAGCQYDKALDTLTIAGGITLSAGQLLVPGGSFATPGLASLADTSDGLLLLDNSVTSAFDGADGPGMSIAGVFLGSDTQCYFLGNTNDSRICRDGSAGTIQLGADSNTPATQTLKALDAVSGNNNGSNIAITPGNKAGTGSDGVAIIGKSYTVATLPTGTVGGRAWVTDATTCTLLGALTGGGSTVCPVFYNGTAWVGG